jgi:hypothetical protein
MHTQFQQLKNFLKIVKYLKIEPCYRYMLGEKINNRGFCSNERNSLLPMLIVRNTGLIK